MNERVPGEQKKTYHRFQTKSLLKGVNVHNKVHLRQLGYKEMKICSVQFLVLDFRAFGTPVRKRKQLVRRETEIGECTSHLTRSLAPDDQLA